MMNCVKGSASAVKGLRPEGAFTSVLEDKPCGMTLDTSPLAGGTLDSTSSVGLEAGEDIVTQSKTREKKRGRECILRGKIGLYLCCF
jgi:hypothetical protein